MVLLRVLFLSVLSSCIICIENLDQAPTTNNISRVNDNHNNSQHHRRRDNTLLQLTICLLRSQSVTTSFDVELWEDLVRKKAAGDLIRNRLCDISLSECIPSLSGQRKSAGERYLTSLIFDSIGLCENSSTLNRGDLRNCSITGDGGGGGNEGADSILLFFIFILIIFNVTGTCGIVYKYRSDCSLSSKNIDEHYGDENGGPTNNTRAAEDNGQFQTLILS